MTPFNTAEKHLSLSDLVSRARALTCLTAHGLRVDDKLDCWSLETLAEALDAARSILDEVLLALPDMEVQRNVQLRVLPE